MPGDVVGAQVPLHVQDALVGRYNRKVHVLDGVYHLWAGNAREMVKRNGRSRDQIVGALMRCGAIERDRAWVYEWAHRAVVVEEADLIAVPCSDCFPSTSQEPCSDDPDGQHHVGCGCEDER